MMKRRSFFAVACAWVAALFGVSRAKTQGKSTERESLRGYELGFKDCAPLRCTDFDENFQPIILVPFTPEWLRAEFEIEVWRNKEDPSKVKFVCRHRVLAERNLPLDDYPKQYRFRRGCYPKFTS